jgi:hypothetical protein
MSGQMEIEVFLSCKHLLSGELNMRGNMVVICSNGSPKLLHQIRIRIRR